MRPPRQTQTSTEFGPNRSIRRSYPWSASLPETATRLPRTFARTVG